MDLLGDRKRAVLSAVIESYIRTGEPVGSKLLTQYLDFSVSSATIRNDMAELSAKGYLEQPHTSAGRVPTAKAFRLYIDQLMPRKALENERREAITRRLQSAAGDPERLLSEATQMLSETTGCAAITTPPSEVTVTLRRVEFLRMSARTVMVALMTSSGSLRSRLCRVDASVDDEHLAALCTLLSDRFVGQPLSDIHMAQLQQLLVALGTNGLLMSGLITGFCDLIRESVKADVLMSGQFQLIENPDYEWEHARVLLNFLSRREQLAAMLSMYNEGLQVLLGSESLCPELNGSSVIMTRYSPDGHQSGSIGLIGPVRMDYARVIPQLEFMAHAMERLMGELW
ncbi:MAG: heat-inducible transcription repressor HrcA [Clostridia bacterium]|nr:heat-inducible transcription repressor HrcA [Clostridia bacterium]